MNEQEMLDEELVKYNEEKKIKKIKSIKENLQKLLDESFLSEYSIKNNSELKREIDENNIEIVSLLKKEIKKLDEKLIELEKNNETRKS